MCKDVSVGWESFKKEKKKESKGKSSTKSTLTEKQKKYLSCWDINWYEIPGAHFGIKSMYVS